MTLRNNIGILSILLFIGISYTHGGGNGGHAQCVIDYGLGNFRQALLSCSDAQNTAQDRQIGNYLLGEIYNYGRDVEKDQEKASGYYLSSASAGYPPAQLNVGHYYADKSRENAMESVRWYLRAGSEQWDGAAYALARAGDVLYELKRKYDAYKCLYASEQLGYEADANAIARYLSAVEKQRAEKETQSWLENRDKFSLVERIEH